MRKLLKDLAIVGLCVPTGVAIAYRYSSQRRRADIRGSCQSISNSCLAFWVLAKTVWRYQVGLFNLDSSSQQYLDKRSQIHSETANDLLDLSEKNKGLYLKFGQYIGNLEKVIPSEFTSVLKTLQDKAPSVPYEEIKTIIQESTNKKVEQIFSEFQREAFSAASLAQVHRAKLGAQNVAVKLQFPTLRVQTQWDLKVMNKIAEICSFLISNTQYKELDVMKLFHVWTSTIEQQLNFLQEVSNGEKTSENFKNDKFVKVPKYYRQNCFKRMIVMEYVEGVKINDVEGIKQLGLDPKKVAHRLVQIMGKMIFRYGFVHCDAHPGNILVRKSQAKNNKEDFEIILLDHGMYQSLDHQFVDNFANLWMGMMEGNEKKVRLYSKALSIEDHIQYLPLLFMNRTKESKKKIGENLTEEEKKYFKEKGLKNFDDIAQFIQDLPSELMFVIRASNLIALHNLALGGTRRDRLMSYSIQCQQRADSYSWVKQMQFRLKIWIFQHFNSLYRLMFVGRQ